MLIGKCNPNDAPNTLKKNRNKTPMTSLTPDCATKRIGFNGAPTINNIAIRTTILITMTVESKFIRPPSACPPYIL